MKFKIGDKIMHRSFHMHVNGEVCSIQKRTNDYVIRWFDSAYGTPEENPNGIVTLEECDYIDDFYVRLDSPEGTWYSL